MESINRIIKFFLLFLIRSYQLILSPFVGQHCRYYPSCSHYAKDAVHTHGPWQGSWLAVKRVCRCHPWHEGGIDPVPGSELEKTIEKEQSQLDHKQEQAQV